MKGIAWEHGGRGEETAEEENVTGTPQTMLSGMRLVQRRARAPKVISDDEQDMGQHGALGHHL